ncbi:GNAT family N-acetyltransferase [Rubrobacter indicoceani]|uniref:GNAT family N-acetyltransferase n=1 Tax=Rubrobacter indicoceani TaxID=2051957 RepID=UPI0013C4D981|nr:GNAT family N-acetyltransferase [Rubrobacter indicoceani]
MSEAAPRTLAPCLRRYRPEDKEAVISLHFRALEEVGAYAEELADYLDRDLDDVEGCYLSNGGEFLVGTLDGEVVAMGALRRVSDREAELKRMRVEPGCQRRGFGRMLLARLEERAAELGISTLELDTTAGQTGARRLYEGAGYVFAGTGVIGSFECLFYRKTLA